MSGRGESSATNLLRRRAEGGEPVVLTLAGQVELVVRDAPSQQLLFDLVDRLETIAAVQEGLDAADRGERRPAAEVFAEIGARVLGARLTQPVEELPDTEGHRRYRSSQRAGG